MLFISILILFGCLFANRVQAASLRSLAEPYGVYMGAAINNIYFDEEEYVKILGEEYSLATSENSCKFAPTEPGQDDFSFTGCDSVLNMTREKEMVFRGHNFVWGNNNPDWLEAISASGNATELERVMIHHIHQVGKYYSNNAFAWDVVNEAVSDHHDFLKANTWFPLIPDYIAKAFTAAREAVGPDVKLFYNDYAVASALGQTQAKSDRMYSVIKGLIDRKIPIDGVGFQTHIPLNYNASGIRQNIERYGALGLEVHLTEMDVSSANQWGPNEQQEQAQVYAAILDICLSLNQTCKNFETWGFTDKHTWKDTSHHPLPYDEYYQPKLAYTALKETLQGNKSWVNAYWQRMKA